MKSIKFTDSNKRKDSLEVKMHNRKLIIFNILKYGLLSRNQLAQLLGMTKGGISPIINSMIEEGVLVEAGIIDTASGRKPRLLKLNDHHMNALAINWARSFYEIAIVSISGKIIDYYQANVPKGIDLDSFLMELNKQLVKMKEKHTGLNIVGIGVAAPGPIDLSTKTILEPPYFNNFSNIKVAERIGADLDLPIYLENDADARAIAEKYFGIGRKYTNFVHITVMEGIGASIVSGGSHFRNDAYAGEFGHMTIDFNGRPCGCGNRGCIESYSSIRAIKEIVSSKVGMELTWEDIVDRAKENDIICTEIVKTSIKYLGYGLISFINMFQPKSIVIGGRFTELGEDFILGDLNRIIEERFILRNYYLPKLYLSKVENDCIRGSAMSVFENILTLPRE